MKVVLLMAVDEIMLSMEVVRSFGVGFESCYRREVSRIYFRYLRVRVATEKLLHHCYTSTLEAQGRTTPKLTRYDSFLDSLNYMEFFLSHS